MKKFIRSVLLNVPPVQRQLARLTALEVEIAQMRLQVDTQGASIEELANRPPLAPLEVTVPAPAVCSSLDEALAAANAEIARLKQDLRLATVGHGSTLDELADAGRAGGGTAYRFDELCGLAPSAGTKAPQDVPSVPPLVFVHIPKAGGTTLNNILMKNYRWRIDSYGDRFFPRYYPDEFISLVDKPLEDDTRRPVYFTGHIDLANDVFRYMPVRYAAITMLRDPVKRFVSHYKFHSTLPKSPLYAEINGGALDIVTYYHRFRATIPMQYEVFAPVAAGAVVEARIAEAVSNLDSKVSIFGFQDEYDAFVVMLQELLGLPDVFYSPLNQTVSDAVDVTPQQVDELKGLMQDEMAFFQKAKVLYAAKVQSLPFDLAAKVSAFRTAKDRYNELRNGTGPAGHAWRNFYS